MKRCHLIAAALLLVVGISSSNAFVVPTKTTTTATTTTTSIPTLHQLQQQQHDHCRQPLSNNNNKRSLTQLSERRWNFNDGQGPWGLKTNAEIWNGRVAQVAFVVIFLQELIQGKGVIQGISDGDFFNYFVLGLTALGTVGLTVWLAIKGDDSLEEIEM